MPAAVSALTNTWPQIAIYLLSLLGVGWFLWREIKAVARTIESHETKCSARWQKNWADHEDIGQRVSHIEGMLDVKRQKDT